jgi:hypothetical protein
MQFLIKIIRDTMNKMIQLTMHGRDGKFELQLIISCVDGKPTCHRVIMYYIVTKAICCHPYFGQFLGSYQTLGGGGIYFCRFYLAAFNAVLIARTIMTKYIIIISTYFFDLKQIYRNEYILIPLNFVATAAMHTTAR